MAAYSLTYTDLNEAISNIEDLQTEIVEKAEKTHDHTYLQNGHYYLKVQTDGNLVFYDTSSGTEVVIWSALYGLTT